MGRRRRGKYKKTILTRLEQDIAILHSHRFEQPELEELRASLCRRYITQEALTPRQTNAVYKLAKPIRTRSRKIRTDRGKMSHWVYAISDGAFIKVGYTLNPDSRLKEMQVGNVSELKIEGKIKCPTRSSAKRLEKQIHKAGKKHRVRGEWFTDDVLRFFDEAGQSYG